VSFWLSGSGNASTLTGLLSHRPAQQHLLLPLLPCTYDGKIGHRPHHQNVILITRLSLQS
jgi:hypothetical protein